MSIPWEQPNQINNENYRTSQPLLPICPECKKMTGKNEPLKKAQKNKIANVTDSVSLGLFMDGSKCKLPSSPPSTDLSRIQHWKMVIANFEF